jgi:hypothetical protein
VVRVAEYAATNRTSAWYQTRCRRETYSDLFRGGAVFQYPHSAFLQHEHTLYGRYIYTLTFRCEGTAATADRRDCRCATSRAGSFGSPGELSVAENAALETASCVVSEDAQCGHAPAASAAPPSSLSFSGDEELAVDLRGSSAQIIFDQKSDTPTISNQQWRNSISTSGISPPLR